MDGAVPERLGQGLVDEAMLVDQREPAETRARDGHLEVVATAGAIFDAQLVRVRKRVAQQRFESVGGHTVMLATQPRATRAGPHRWRGASELSVHGLFGSISAR